LQQQEHNNVVAKAIKQYGNDYSQEDLQALLLDNTFGPEQTAVYSREFASSASACCPNVYNEGRYMDADMDELKEWEQEVATAVLVANQELWKEHHRAREGNHEQQQQEQQLESNNNNNNSQQGPNNESSHRDLGSSMGPPSSSLDPLSTGSNPRVRSHC
jgi:hypothetical protein